MTTPKKQQGAVLIISLIILLLVTVLSVTGMNNGIQEMRMSVNEEMRVVAVQTAQAAVDEVSELTNSFIVTGIPGDVVKCTSNVTGVGCPDNTLALTGPGASTYDKVLIRRIFPEIGSPNPSRLTGGEYSVDSFQAAFFQIEAEHDSTAVDGGRTSLVQGYMLLMPDAD